MGVGLIRTWPRMGGGVQGEERMDYEDMEAAVLKGFVKDRQLITIALNEGFTPELLPSPVAKRLCNGLIDLYLARGGELINEMTVRNHLETRGVFNAEMEH